MELNHPLKPVGVYISESLKVIWFWTKMISFKKKSYLKQRWSSETFWVLFNQAGQVETSTFKHPQWCCLAACPWHRLSTNVPGLVPFPLQLVRMMVSPCLPSCWFLYIKWTKQPTSIHQSSGDVWMCSEKRWKGTKIPRVHSTCRHNIRSRKQGKSYWSNFWTHLF